MAAPRKRRSLVVFVIVLCLALITASAPLMVSKGIRWWLWWKTRGTNVTVTIDAIVTPFLRPILLRGVRVRTAPGAAARVDVSAARVVLGLNLRSVLFRTRGRAVRSLEVQGLHAEIRRNRAGVAFPEDVWNTLHHLLPESFDLESADFRLETDSTLALLRGVALSGSPIEAGRFQAGEIVISSPLFRQTFANLRGATDWQSDRLTVAALTLARGLDVQTVTTDLSHLGKRRIGLDFDLDAFGGKLRASIADEWRSRHSNWNMAGSANDISLSQTAEAFGFTNRIGGLLHAGKFTFRGDLADALTGTASLWMELTAPAWRDSEADLITLGLSLYGRQVELQQLYIKQRKNELTLSGESSFPATAAGWLQPDFRGNVSASIDDLGDFATLFGGNRQDFAGRIEVEGTFNARDRRVGGNLVANGTGLTMFKNSVDEFRTTLNIGHDDIEIVDMEFRRKNDRLQMKGKIGTSADHNYSGAVDATIADVTQYVGGTTNQPQRPPVAATLHANITSSLWEAHAVVDPSVSKPIDMTFTFPFRIGQSLEQVWTSPINLHLDAPMVRLSEIVPPNWLSHVQGATGMAEVTITDSLRHPKIAGYTQISGMAFGRTRLDYQARFERNIGIIETMKVADGQHEIFFGGNMDLQDTQHISVQLLPNQPLHDLTSLVFNCVNTADLRTIDPTTPGLMVDAIQLTGPLGNPDWQITVREMEFADLLKGAVTPVFSRTFQFCRGPNTPELSLTLAIPTAALPSPAPSPRPRKKRR
jgi:hypothetical protein